MDYYTVKKTYHKKDGSTKDYFYKYKLSPKMKKYKTYKEFILDVLTDDDNSELIKSEDINTISNEIMVLFHENDIKDINISYIKRIVKNYLENNKIS